MATATAPATAPTLNDDQAGEVLAMMLEAKGPAAVDDLAGAIARESGRPAAEASRWADVRRRNGQFAEHVPDVVRSIKAGVDRSRVYRSRMAALAKLGSVEAGAAAAGFPATTAEAETHAILLDAAGQVYASRSRAYLAATAETLRGSIADVAPQLENLKRGHAEGRAYSNADRCQHAGGFDVLAAHVAGRDAMAEKLSKLDAFAADAAKVRAARVSAAIAAGGGADAVATGVREAWMISGLPTPDPDAQDLKAKADAVAALDAQLAQLGGPGGGGQLAASIAADRSAAAKDLESARGGADGRLKARIAALVKAAVAGDEPARAQIEAAARSQPRAFKPGVADAMMKAQPEWDPAHGPGVVAMILLASAGAN